MILLVIVAVGWVLATGAVYCTLVRGQWLLKAAMLAVSGAIGAAVARLVLYVGSDGTGGNCALALCMGAMAFTFAAEAQLLVWGVRRSDQNG
ncbi:hypothetical protein OLX02_02160 [Novosphingobium sp. KCTC 2891]|uniref:hypothetical protein n=1 Tax=Novosphingobium sp. KCTC 2891 TaxID=2989730 RepID=UPI0022221001|nr:hypothetical protein [Novosphingobium sp. KCTC 2891]MCW1381618.1 hypothetical protein [Novosphingobium sp. KCTC 2891]